jgi:hypothetical protein
LADVTSEPDDGDRKKIGRLLRFTTPFALPATRHAVTFAALLVTTLVSLPAHAGFTATFSNSSSAGGGLTNFLYSLNFNVNSSGDVLNNGDFLTFYDVGPVTSVVPLGLTFTQSLIGPTAGTFTPIDAPSIFNATFTYTGPTLTVPTAFNVTLTSPRSETAEGFYTSQTTIPPDGSIATFGATFLPAAAAPEPGSLALLLPILGGASIVLRRRKQ